MKDILEKIAMVDRHSKIYHSVLNDSAVTFAMDKSNELLYMVITPNLDENVKEFDKIIAYKLTEKDGVYTDTKVGYLDYKLIENSRECWIHNVSVTDKEFLGLGIGTYLLKNFEEFAYKNFKPNIEGKFYPKEPGNYEQVMKFYQSNGYFVDRYDNWRISKTLWNEDYKDIKNNTTMEHNYKIYGPLENFKKFEPVVEPVK